MRRETWFVDSKEEVLRPEMLLRDPDRYGGLGMHMLSAIQNGIVTIPLKGEYGACVGIQVSDNEAVDRILADGKVNILSDGYWCSIHSDKIKVVYFDTDEAIPLWKGGVYQ